MLFMDPWSPTIVWQPAVRYREIAMLRCRIQKKLKFQAKPNAFEKRFRPPFCEVPVGAICRNRLSLIFALTLLLPILRPSLPKSVAIKTANLQC
jgi:hypothetical protein